MSKKVSFSVFELRIEDLRACQDVFADLELCHNSRITNFPIDDKYYLAKTFLDKYTRNSYFFIETRSGSPSPRAPKLHNLTTGLDVENGRKPDEVEPIDQFFAMYNKNKGLLYISNYKQKKIFEEYVALARGFENNSIQLTPVIGDPQKFVKLAQTVKSLRFTFRRNLFYKDKIFNPAFFNNGLGDKMLMKFEMSYKKTSVTQEFRDWFLNLVKAGNHDEFDSIKCTTKSIDGMERTFNMEAISEKYEFNVRKDSNGYADVDEVFRLLKDKTG